MGSIAETCKIERFFIQKNYAFVRNSSWQSEPGVALDPPLYGAGGGTCQLNCFGCVLQESYGRNLLLVLFTFEDDPNSFARESYFVRWFYAPFVVEQMRVGATILVAQVVNVDWNKVVAAVAKNDSLIPFDCLFDSVPMIGWS